MPEQLFFRLRDIAQSIQNKLSGGIQNSFWVKAELNEMTLNQVSGNCYVNLIDKQEGRLVAQFRGMIWKSEYQRINKKFLEVLKEPLKAGIGILFQTRLSYHPVFGLSLEIVDIDPSFSLGELEKEKQESIEKLKKEGIFEKNKKLSEPLLIKRLAVISSKSSKGYSDFMKIIYENNFGYGINVILFPSILQGDPAIRSIKNQLEKIKKVQHHFDAVAIIRGGGDEFGMTCYNNYQLSKTIADFPLPVYTGIGHSTNESVSEMVSYFNAITPTQLGEYVLSKFHFFSEPIIKFQTEIWNDIKGILSAEKKNVKNISSELLRTCNRQLKLLNIDLKHTSKEMYGSVIHRIETEKGRQENSLNILNRNIKYYFADKRKIIFQKVEILKLRSFDYLSRQIQRIELFQKTVDVLNPKALLQKGYSITVNEWRKNIDINNIKKGDTLITTFLNAEVYSEIIKIIKSKKNED